MRFKIGFFAGAIASAFMCFGSLAHAGQTCSKKQSGSKKPELNLQYFNLSHKRVVPTHSEVEAGKKWLAAFSKKVGTPKVTSLKKEDFSYHRLTAKPAHEYVFVSDGDCFLVVYYKLEDKHAFHVIWNELVKMRYAQEEAGKGNKASPLNAAKLKKYDEGYKWLLPVLSYDELSKYLDASNRISDHVPSWHSKGEKIAYSDVKLSNSSFKENIIDIKAPRVLSDLYISALKLPTNRTHYVLTQQFANSFEIVSVLEADEDRFIRAWNDFVMTSLIDDLSLGFKGKANLAILPHWSDGQRYLITIPPNLFKDFQKTLNTFLGYYETFKSDDKEVVSLKKELNLFLGVFRAENGQKMLDAAGNDTVRLAIVQQWFSNISAIVKDPNSLELKNLQRVVKNYEAEQDKKKKAAEASLKAKKAEADRLKAERLRIKKEKAKAEETKTEIEPIPNAPIEDAKVERNYEAEEWEPQNPFFVYEDQLRARRVVYKENPLEVVSKTYSHIDYKVPVEGNKFIYISIYVGWEKAFQEAYQKLRR